MDGEVDLFQGFNRLANKIRDERDKRAGEGASDVDVAYDLLALVLQHYHEEYRAQIDGGNLLEDTLGPYPFEEMESNVPPQRVKDWLLLQCDRKREFLPREIIDALRGEYLTFLWRSLERVGVVSPSMQDVVADTGKARSVLLGLGFSEPYWPKWGFEYICGEFERARDTLMAQVDVEVIDAEVVQAIRDNTILVWKGYKRLLKMLLSFYGQYAFGDALVLVTELNPDVHQPRKYLESRCLRELVELVVQLGKYSDDPREKDAFWEGFSDTAILKQNLIDGLQRLCSETKEQLNLGNRAAFQPEKIPSIRQYILRRMVGHLLDLREEYRAAFPLIVALKTYRQDEDGRVRIDYLDENGEWGVLRKEIAFQPQRDFYLFRRSERSPVIIPVEEIHQDFIIRHDLPIRKQLDDAELRTLFDKFEKCRKGLERSGPQEVVFVPTPARVVSPWLDKLGISQDGEVVDEALLAQAIKRALEEGETDMVEFKAGPSEDAVIAKELAALANTKGGVLVFGLPDNPTVGSREWNQAVSGRDKLSNREFRNNFLVRIDKIARGAPGQFHHCAPGVDCVPHVRVAAKYLSEAKGEIVVVAVLPIAEGAELRHVTGEGVYVRLWGSSEKATPEQLKIYSNTGRKSWMRGGI